VSAPALVVEAVERLCQRFENNDYNPTPLIDLGVLVANADGKIDPEELETLREILEPILGAQLNAELVGFLVTASLKVITAAGSEPRARLIAEILMDCDAVEDGMLVALAIAYGKGGGIAPAERALLSAIAEATDLPEERLDALTKQVKDALAKKG